MHKYTIGQLYNPNRTRWPETSQYNVRIGYHELILLLSKPSEREVKSLRRGPAEFALHIEPPVLLLLYRFEPGLPWSDAPFSIHLVPESERDLPSSLETPESRALLHVLMVDVATGILRAIRAVSLSAAFTVELHRAIREQAILPWDPDAYDTKLAEVYSSATSEHLALVARVRCRGGE